MKIRMMPGRILVRAISESPTTSGGLVLPDTVARNVAKGTIVSVDEGKLREGDEILFDSRQATPLKLEGEEFLLVLEGSVHGVLKAKANLKRKNP